MLAAYAFLAAFLLQILLTSVLYPAWFIKYVRLRASRLPAERVAQLYPGVDLAGALERCLARYRVLTRSIAVLGVLLLGWLFSYMRHPDWDDGPVEALVSAYFATQMLLPVALVVWFGVRFDKAYKLALPESKRTAMLQRRGLFDFVSPFVVALAALCYVLFAAFVLYIRQHPFPGFAGLISLGGITLVYAVNALVVFMMIYGKNRNPFESHAGRLRTIGLAVKSCVYSCIVIVVYLSLNFSLVLLDLQRWEPFALSTFFVVCVLVTSIGVLAPLREQETIAEHA
jgi:hypothetical protein